ncbi:LysR family transcriptional regulator [Aquabacterium sp. A7-Y]|uniref:LysR family transcriptional regulator n=1 Tax=Aquabacterium sp. A7-Y TaxID=1349605 RepID=UPI00223D480B|nr:LysR family transcriptional regulator [Aquabacterium sp. A7-Y]MCW7539233.1 LysR family transcriptional regulator [Aquabacterium sp. A7-Y]
MDRLNSMRAFAKVIDEGGFAAAARAMDVSAAAVTRLVADLENHLKVRLIHRSTRRLALTPTGQGYLERVRSILHQLEEAEAQVDAAVRQPQGPLRIKVPAASVARQLTRHLPGLQRQFPGLRLSFNVAGTAGVAVTDVGWDAALLVGGSAPPSGLDSAAVVRSLSRGAGALCASPAYLARHGMPTHPAELAQHECLLASPDGDSGGTAQWQLSAHAESLAVHSSAAFSSAHPDTLYASAVAGLALVGLPSVMVEDALTDGTLVQVLPQWRTPTFTLYAAMPSRKFVPSRTRAFMDFLAEVFATPTVAAM